MNRRPRSRFRGGIYPAVQSLFAHIDAFDRDRGPALFDLSPFVLTRHQPSPTAETLLVQVPRGNSGVTNPDSRNGCRAPSALWFDPASGGGRFGAWWIAPARPGPGMAGRIRQALPRLLTVSDRSDLADDSYSLRSRLQSGVEGSMQQSAGAWGTPTTLVRCAGSRGTVWIDGGKLILADREGTRQLDVPEDLRLPVIELSPSGPPANV